MTVRMIWLARVARKDYGALICAGVAALMMAQTLENIGMCLAMVPVVGITLPFCSYRRFVDPLSLHLSRSYNVNFNAQQKILF